MSSEAVSILLVDDSPASLLALESALKELGESLHRATSGEAACERALDTDFAVILLDVRMPTMDGFDTATRLRAKPRSASTPIIFLTAQSGDESDIERALERCSSRLGAG